MCQRNGGIVGSQRAECWGLREAKGWVLGPPLCAWGSFKCALYVGGHEKNLGGSSLESSSASVAHHICVLEHLASLFRETIFFQEQS